MDGETCAGTRKDGTPCRARRLPGSECCFAHDDTLRGKREAAYATGGRNKGAAQRVQRLVPHELRPVLSLLLTALEETHAGTLPPQQAGAMSALAGAIARLYGAVEIEARMSAIERRVTTHGDAP
jgi:hypothetical protein